MCADRGIPWLGRGGASAHLRGIAAGYAACGVQVEAWVRALMPSEGPPALPPLGVRALEGPPRFAEFVTRQARRLNPALMHERYSLDGGCPSPCGVWLLEVNAPLVWEQALFRGGAISRQALAAERHQLQAPDAALAVSQPLADWIPRDDVWVIPNGVARRSGPSPATAAAPTSPASAFVLGFEGTFKPWHGLVAEVSGLSSLSDSVGQPVHVQLAGDGPLRSAVTAALTDLAARDPRITHDVLGSLDAPDLAAARACWHAAWSPEAPWPPDRPDLTSRAGAPIPPRWFAPLKEAEAAAAGLGLWKGGVLMPPPSPPRTWAEIARDLLCETGVVPAGAQSWDDAPL